jgi:hypothetical protein
MTSPGAFRPCRARTILSDLEPYWNEGKNILEITELNGFHVGRALPLTFWSGIASDIQGGAAFHPKYTAEHSIANTNTWPYFTQPWLGMVVEQL